ncbi:13148_t:CDS:1, partial [Gigaspora rosea]
STLKTSDNKQASKDKKCRNDDLEKLAKKFDKFSKNLTQIKKNKANKETQQELDRAKR